jgi:hypothetical protein
MSGDRRSRRPHVSAVVPSDRTRPGHGRRYGSTGRVSTVAIARLDRRPRGAATAQADTDARPRRGTHPSPACVCQGTRACRSRCHGREEPPLFLHARGHRELRGLERALTMREILSCELRIALALDHERKRHSGPTHCTRCMGTTSRSASSPSVGAQAPSLSQRGNRSSACPHGTAAPPRCKQHSGPAATAQDGRVSSEF